MLFSGRCMDVLEEVRKSLCRQKGGWGRERECTSRGEDQMSGVCGETDAERKPACAGQARVDSGVCPCACDR